MISTQVAIGTDPPKEVPKDEFDKLEEQLEELKEAAAKDFADDGSVDSELEEKIKELEETLVDVVPVDLGPPSGIRLFRAAARAVLVLVAEPKVAVRRRRRASLETDQEAHLASLLDAFQACHRWLGASTYAHATDLHTARDLSPCDTAPLHKQRQRALALASRADNLIWAVGDALTEVPTEVLKLCGLWAVDGFYAPAWYLWRSERKMLLFDELGATRHTLVELEDAAEAASLAARSARARLNVTAPTATSFRYLGDNFATAAPACVDAATVDDVDGFPCAPEPWPRILGRCFARRPNDPPPPVDPQKLRALLLNFVVGRVLIPWVILRPFLTRDPPAVRSERDRAAKNARAVASLLYRALRNVGGAHAELVEPALPSRGVEASEASSAEIAWQWMQPRSIANRVLGRPRVPYARSRPAAPRAPPVATLDGAPPWSVAAPGDADVHAWVVAPYRRMPQRDAFLKDADLARLLFPDDAWGAGAADVLDGVVNDLAADLASLGDRILCAVLEARAVR